MGHHGRRRTISLQLHALWIFVRWRKRHQPSHARHLRSLQRHGGLSLECAAKRTTDWKLFTIQRPHRRYLRQPVWGSVFIQGRTAAAPAPASAIMASRPFKTLLRGRTHKHRQSLNPPLCYACHWAKRPCHVAHPYRRSYVNAVGGPIQTK